MLLPGPQGDKAQAGMVSYHPWPLGGVWLMRAPQRGGCPQHSVLRRELGYSRWRLPHCVCLGLEGEAGKEKRLAAWLCDPERYGQTRWATEP